MEARIVRAAQHGDRPAFGQLVDMYKTKLYHLAYRMLGNRQEAEDVVQDSFVRLVENFHKYDPTQKFSTWLFRIATNLCIDRLRKRKRQMYSLDAETSSGDGIDGYAMIADQGPEPDEQLIVTERQQIISQAMKSMPEKYKSVMVLKYFHELSLQEISDVLQMPVTTVKTRMHRGRDYLRTKLKRFERDLL